MLILGIETSCDETSASVMKIASGKMRFLSNIVSSQIKTHAKTGGVVPEVAARMHIEKIIPVIKLALQKAGINLRDIDVIAVASGPGLLSSLLIGVDTAKSLSTALNVPIIAINHVEAHIFSPFVRVLSSKLQVPSSVFPAISLVVSGGHTELFLVKDWLEYKKLGQTLDDAAGECFDKTAKLLDLPYPGGPSLSKLAEHGKPTIDFPRPMLKSNDFNFSFSGLKTAVLYYLRDVITSPSTSLRINSAKQSLSTKRLPRSLALPRNDKKRADIAASIQAAIVDVLIAKTMAAAKKYRAKSILLGGGVAANLALRSKFQVLCSKLKADFLVAEPEYCTDNAAMIAFAGALRARKKKFTPLNKVAADSNWEL